MYNTVHTCVAEPEPEPPEPYHFDPRRTGTVSLLKVPVPVPVPVAQKISNSFYSDRTLADTYMKLAREETKIMVTGRSFIIKITKNLRVGTGTGAGIGTVGKKIGTRNRNRNLGKMARFRNTGT